MSASYHPGLHRYVLFVALCTLLLLVAGALVTSNEAALSVPTWPGPLMPPMVGGVRFEHSHRIIAAAVGLLTIVLAVVIWTKERRNWVKWLSVAAVIGVSAQGILGGQVVRQLLRYGLPVAHACLAQLFFGMVVALALFTSRWWLSEQPQLEDRGSPSVHFLVLLNAGVIFLQVVFGAGFRHKDIPIWPHLIGAGAVTVTITWSAAVLRRRFESSRAIGVARILLHSIFGTQFLLGIGAWWSRAATADAPQPMPVMIAFTVTHTVVGALTLACSLVVALLCYRLIPRGGEVTLPSHERAALP